MVQLRLLGFGISIVCVIVLVAVARRCRGRSRVFAGLAPALFYLGHMLLFYVVRLYEYPFDTITLNMWSLAIHIQAALTVTFLGYEWMRDRRNDA